MSPVPEHLEVLVLGNGNSIQPVEPGAAFAREAEPVDRLAGDVELINRLMWAQYEGLEWRLFRAALAQYGVVVLRKWIFSGRIFAECKRKGFGALQRRRRDDRDDALGIAGETVARAFLFFRDRVLVRGVWDAAKGASVRTYFIGACILHFPNVYQRSLGSERLPLALEGFDADDPLQSLRDTNHFSRPDHLAELASDFRAIRDPQTREIVLRTTEGHSHKQIARDLHTSSKAVELKLYRLHQRKA
jgi:DNA-directed RNA polymerase specialized sigma24 family protein